MIGELAGPHSVRRNVVRAHVHSSQIDRPQLIAVHVVGVNTLRSKPGDHDAPIRHRRRARIGGLDMPPVARLFLGRDALPGHSACGLVDRVEHPLVAGSIVRRITVAVQAGLERGVALAADRARHEDAIAPDDRAGVREAGNRRTPADAFVRGGVPCLGQVLPIRDTRRIRAAEGRPAPGCRFGRRQRRCPFGAGSRDGARRNRVRFALRQPGAVSQHHLARHAGIRHRRQHDPRAFNLVSVAA